MIHRSCMAGIALALTTGLSAQAPSRPASFRGGDGPDQQVDLSESDLPIVVITTMESPIPDEPKIDGTMGIIFNGPGQPNHLGDPYNAYDGHIGIETRGHSSQVFPKKSYGLELRDADGLALDLPLLGMPAENDWVLSASFPDKSLLNHALAFDLGERMGHYTPRWRHVEVVLNGEYVGVYLLMEKIKRGAGRVDIAKLTADEITGDQSTGGYIIQVDRAGSPGWTGDFQPTTHFVYEYPKAPAPEQATYIQAYFQDLQAALAGPGFADPDEGYARYIDVPSAIDFLLVNELARNVDGYRLSTYLHKDKDSNGGKLRFGPLWDFDLGFRNADYCIGSAVQGWAYDFNNICPGAEDLVPFWWRRFLQDPAFTDLLRCRWEELRDNVLGPERIGAWCDSMATYLWQAQERNFTAWDILGEYVWPNPAPIPADYLGEIEELKDWVTARWNWMDAHLQGTCTTTAIATASAADRPLVVPSPFSDRLTVRLPEGVSGPVQVELVDPLGRRMLARHIASAPGTIDLDVPVTCPSGMYILRLSATGKGWSLPVMKMD